MTGDPRLVFQAIAYDPLTASVLSLAEIKTVVNEMLAQNKDHLTTFKHFGVVNRTNHVPLVPYKSYTP